MIKYYLEDKGEVKGFLAVNFKKGFPHLQHFYLNVRYRNADNVRTLIKAFVNIVKKLGYKTAYIHACTGRQMKLIEYYFKKKPYGLKDKHAWYIVNV